LQKAEAPRIGLSHRRGTLPPSSGCGAFVAPTAGLTT